MSASSQALPSAPFPILTSVAAVRSWRAERLARGERVGFVPTMGALHEGHLSLVSESLKHTDSTIVSIFVNPAQFAPHEDLSTYPRTLESDIEKLARCHFDPSSTTDGPRRRTVAALFLPPVSALYPSGITTTVSDQRGAFVEVKGLQDTMEGASRPGFFRGVATVVVKLFNLVEPDFAYFGQKDIQQALLLRRLLVDLHVPRPLSHHLVIVPTHRDGASSLALSSRNAYLSRRELEWANVLVEGLKEGEREWKRQEEEGRQKEEEGQGQDTTRWVDVRQVRRKAEESIEATKRRCEVETHGEVSIELLYIALNDPEELYDLERIDDGKVETVVGDRTAERGGGGGRRGAILSGAVMLGKTRLIDNFILGGYDLNPTPPLDSDE
ncbi:hypothetical protein JCM10212_001346 [Sporobolomyces blumeae]